MHDTCFGFYAWEYSDTFKIVSFIFDDNYSRFPSLIPDGVGNEVDFVAVDGVLRAVVDRGLWFDESGGGLVGNDDIREENPRYPNSWVII